MFLPVNFQGYYEPFLGSGAFFFYLHREGLLKDCDRVMLSDTNYELAHTYIAIKSDELLPQVIKKLERHQRNHSTDYFNQIKVKYYVNDVAAIAAKFLYLNKASFSSIYRESSEGAYNVSPRKTSPIWHDPVIFHIAQDVLVKTNAKIRCYDFDFLKTVLEKGDFVYLDPPYQKFFEDGNRTVYGAKCFNRKSQERLHEFCEWMNERGVMFMQSNSDSLFYMICIGVIKSIIYRLLTN